LDTDERGFALYRRGFLLEDDSSPPVLEMHPQWTDDGFIRGEFTVPRIQKGQHFLAIVGFLKPQGTPGTNGVMIKITFNGDILYEGIKTYTGRLLPINIDMSGYDGQAGTLILEVGTNGNAGQDWLCWVNPRIDFP
jgi:hypothetical protein